MNDVRLTSLSLLALSLLLCGCPDDLLVGEQRCFGDGVDCSSPAPTLAPPLDYRARFDFIPSRSVEPTWFYDVPVEDWFGTGVELALAPGGGVWSYRSSTGELERINGEGEPVELHTVGVGWFSVDEELRPTLLRMLGSGHVLKTILGPQGEVWSLPIGEKPLFSLRNGIGPHLLIAGSEGSVHTALFQEYGSYLAEYSALGKLVWRQSEVRDGHFAFEDSSGGWTYQAVVLSDGAIALSVPKDASPPLDMGITGLAAYKRSQGITLVGPDGNVRWDLPLSFPTLMMRLAPGIDGSVVFASGFDDALDVQVLDGDGNRVAHWHGLRAGHHSINASAVCSDAAGDIYALVLAGDRTRIPMPTVCRMRGSDPYAEVVCLAVEGASPLQSEVAGPMLGSMVAPEPGGVVFVVEQSDPAEKKAGARLVRVDF